jgi:hypothetical protein
MKRLLTIIGLLLATSIAVARADPVDVSYTVSGAAGNWTLDFSVTDNLGGTNAIYFFGIRLPARDITGSPLGWDPNATSSWNLGIYGDYVGPIINYNNVWVTSPTGSVIVPGNTLSGFAALDADLTAPLGVDWFAFSAGGNYTGPGCVAVCLAPHDNPGFRGLAAPLATSSIPEPPILPTMLISLGMVGIFSYRRRAKARTAIAA